MLFRSNTFIRDNLNAFSFNMLVVGLLDLIVFVALFIMTMPLPDMLKRGYANKIFQYALPFVFFMMFCMYNLFTTLYKMIRSISDHHSMISEGKKVEPRLFYKRIAKNQRDIILCLIGCGLSYFLLILSTQFKQMTTDKKVEDKSEVPEKTAEEIGRASCRERV